MKFNRFLFSFLAVFFGAFSVPASASFEDISGISGEDAINELTSMGIISDTEGDGTPRTQYYPEKPINRVEFLKFAFEAFGQSDAIKNLEYDPTEVLFTDTDTSQWYYKYVVYADEMSIINGYPGNTFKPSNNITRAEAIKLLLLISGVKTNPDQEVDFFDVDSTAWFYSYIDEAESLCLFEKYQYFMPNKFLTRSEMAIFVKKIIDILAGKDLCISSSDTADEINTPEGEHFEHLKNADVESFSEYSEESSNSQETPLPEEKQFATDQLPEDWNRYEREVYFYSFALPKLWWWNEYVGEDDTISRIEAGTEEEITDDNRTVTIEIVKKVFGAKKEVKTKLNTVIVVPRDDVSSFRVSGRQEFTDQIRLIADSLRVLTAADFDNESPNEDNTNDAASTDELSSEPSGLSVKIMEDSPLSRSIPLHAKNVPFLQLAFQAPEDEDIKIIKLTITRSGLGKSEEIKAVKVYEGYTHRGRNKNISRETNTAPINLTYDPIFIDAGAEKIITVAADIDADSLGGEHSLSILSPEDIVAVGVESGEIIPVTASFPINGNRMATSNINVGNVHFSFHTPENTIEVGGTDEVISVITVSEQESIENMNLRALTLSFAGVEDGNLQNLHLEFRGDVVTNIVNTTENGKATFTFIGDYEDGIAVNQSRQKTLRLVGDVSASPSGDFAVFIADADDDVFSTGKESGF